MTPAPGPDPALVPAPGLAPGRGPGPAPVPGPGPGPGPAPCPGGDPAPGSDRRPPFDYRPLRGRPPMALPGGARVAVWFGVAVEVFEPGSPVPAIAPATTSFDPDPLNRGWLDYGPRVGIWRLMDLLDRVGARASVFLSSDACAAYPQIVEAGNERGWAWLAHGRNNSTLHTGLGVDEERTLLAEVVEVLAKATGRPPLGWLGPGLTETYATPALLAELGVRYVCDWCNDVQPYPLRGPGRMLSVPYTVEVNDLAGFIYHFTGEALYRAIVDAFDLLYAEGEHDARVLGIGLHPFVTGGPWRFPHVARAIEHIAAHPDVWLTTTDDIATWYDATYYDRDAALGETSERRIV